MVVCDPAPVVTSNNDNGSGSLREAITNACDGATITFDMNQVVSPVNILSAELSIQKSLTISGPGASTLTISGHDQTRIFSVNTIGAVAFSGLTIAQARELGDNGGGILKSNTGTLTITDSSFVNNRAYDSGGAIHNSGSGTVSISNSNFSGNNNLTGNGGAIYNSGSANVSITNSTFSTNNANVGGGALYHAGSGTIDVTNSTFSGNISQFAGGGVNNSGSGTLNISKSTISGNTSAQGGGAGIAARGSGATNVTNSTVSGNTSANTGGGILNDSGALTLTNVTVTNNRSNDNTGGGLGVVLPANSTLHNSIVAGNFGHPSPATTPSDISSQVSATSSFNLIGNGGSGGLSNGSNNNQVDIADARLGSLLNNGGPTLTHSLLPGSPALDAGSNTIATNAGLSTDQRGAGFLRVVDGPDANTTDTVDIGAFEAQVFVEDITDKSTNEDTHLQFDFNVSGTISSVTATSSNTTLVPNNSANLDVSGSGSSRSLSINPAADQFGSSTITVTVSSPTAGSMTDTFVLTVIPIADTPSGTSVATNEDVQTVGGLVLSRNSADGAEVTHFKINNITNGILFKHDGVTPINSGDFITFAEGNAGLRFTPAANLNSNTSIFSFQVQAATSASGSGLSASFHSIQITVLPVNDAPSFTKGANQTVNEDAGAQTVNSWATGISPGPADESGQAVSFNITGNTNPSLFSAAPFISSAGNLTYTTAANANGSATITINIQDNGGTFNGGVDTSAPQTFTITVNAVNDAPSFTKGADPTVNEDAGSQTLGAWATNLSAGPANESGQTLTFQITNNTNPSLFATGPLVNPGGTLLFTPATNANGSATISLVIKDNGGTGNGGVDTSAVQTFTITVNAVNDAPSFTRGPDQTVSEDAAAQTVNNWATAISAGPADEAGQTLTFQVTSNSNAGLFSAGPTISSNGTLSYTPAANANGSATITISLKDNGGTANGGQDTSFSTVFTITVNAVNDAPSFTEGADQSVSNIVGPQTVANWATNISAGPVNESSQTVSFQITGNTNSGLFTAGPAVSSNGTLTFTPSQTAGGTATITLVAKDNGGTAFGGVDTSPAQSFTITVVPLGGSFSFEFSSSSTTENSGSTTINVKRTGNLSGPATVNYATNSDSGVPCSTANGVASPKCDFTAAFGTLSFGAGEGSKPITILISQDSFVEGPETITVTLSNPQPGSALGTPSSTSVTIADDVTEPPGNVIDDASTFVRMHYHDFLNREADQAGLGFWTGQMTNCGNSDLTVCRVNVSGAFFLSIEFRETGYLVERMYKTAYADATATSQIGGSHQIFVPVVRANEFLADTQRVGRGVIVNQGDWQTTLENNKQAYALEFVQTSRFITALPTTMTPAQFVDKLNQNAGVVLSVSERQTVLNLFGNSVNTTNVGARAQALRQVAEDADLQTAEFNRAFVLSQFIGYLRRNPNDAPDSDYTGYDFWLGKLNQFNGDYIKAEMVKAFIASDEYRHRFGN